MRVLVATDELRERTPRDQTHPLEGELVLFELAGCSSPERCGCGRVWFGMASRRSTSTAMIVDLPHLAEHDLREAVSDWLATSGWGDLVRATAGIDTVTDHPEPDVDDVDDVDAAFGSLVDEHVGSIIDACAAFPVGTVLERDGHVVRARICPAAA